MHRDAVRDLLLTATRNRVTPCAVAEVGTADGPGWREAVGRLTYDADAEAASPGTVFDLASLTKVVATTSLAMRLAESERLPVDAPVRDVIPAWRLPDRVGVTIADLLEHASGLPAVLPLHEHCAGRGAFERAICGATLACPPRARSIYSDLGFILLGFIVEDAGQAPLDVQFSRLAAEHGWDADGEPLRYRANGIASALVAPTQVDSWRGRLLRGEVDDANGAALAGVAGHTGLFGSVAAVGCFARDVLTSVGRDGRLGRRSTCARFLQRSTVPGSSRALGWDTMLTTSSCGTRMSARAFGHTGFTGTSLWIDPEAGRYAVLLTNRVYPRAGDGEAIRTLRRAFHDTVWAAPVTGTA